MPDAHEGFTKLNGYKTLKKEEEKEMRKTSCKLLAVFAAALFLALFLTGSGDAFEFKKEYKMQLNVGPTFYWGMGATKFGYIRISQKH
jgi:hypothetical protein